MEAGAIPANIDLGALGKTMLEAARAARIGVIITLVDTLQPRIVYVSEYLAHVMGWSVEELLQRDPLERIAPEHRALAAARLGLRADGYLGESSYEVEILRRDGRRVPVEIRRARRRLMGTAPFSRSSST